MKKLALFLLFTFILLQGIPLENVYATETLTVQVIMNKTNLYTSADLNSLVICTIPHKTKLEVIDTIQNEYGFYRVDFNSREGYVFIGHTMNVANQSLMEILDFNAKVKNDNSNVYNLIKDTYSKVDNIALDKDTEIRILDGYNSKKEYCLISFYYEETVYTFYIKTDDVSPYGVGKNLVVAISLLVTCISIILILFGFSLKNNKKTQNNSEN